MQLQFSTSVSGIKELNESFDMGVLRICYHGRNQNKTDILRSAIEEAAPTMFNCPVVCNYDVEQDEIGGHDISVVKTVNGVRMINLTDGIGVIPESSNFWWEEVEEENGVVNEYFTAEVLIWKRSAAYQKIKSEGSTNHSMEINIKRGHIDDDGYFIIEKFVFTAFCLLGGKPCFQSSSLQMFSADGLKAQFSDMMQELRESMTAMRPPQGVDIYNKNEEGEQGLDENIATPSVTADFALASVFRNELIRAAEAERVETRWGIESKYWFVDYDEELSEVYAYDIEDWLMYGFKYAKNGDKVLVEFSSKKRMKYSIVPFDGGEDFSTLSTMYAHVSDAYSANQTQWEEKYRAAEQNAAAQEAELTELRQYKADAEYAKSAAERDVVLERFADLGGNEEFEALKENAAEYGLDALEEKCFAIRGRNVVMKFSAPEQPPPKLPVEKTVAVDATPEPYGGIFSRYGARENV
jgi:hypothetical protein